MALTPLVDVLFLLLIFFMLGSSLVFQPGISVDPPEVDEPFKSFADKLVITIDQDNRVFFNDQMVPDLNVLASKLDSAVYRYSVLTTTGQDDDAGRRSRPPIILLKADKRASYDDVVKIMSITRQYGARVFLVTRAVAP